MVLRSSLPVLFASRSSRLCVGPQSLRRVAYLRATSRYTRESGLSSYFPQRAALLSIPRQSTRRGYAKRFGRRANYVSKPTAGDGLQSFRPLPAGSGLTRR